MRQEITFLRAVPAQVVGFLSRDSVHVILYPGTRADEPIRGIDGQFYQSKTPIPREVWPDELLRPNAEVWLIYERQSVAVAEEGEVIEVCPRVDRHPPEK
jgi:hypothetical protein